MIFVKRNLMYLNDKLYEIRTKRWGVRMQQIIWSIQ